MKHITTSDQTIWDLSHQLYGDASHAVKILLDNPSLGSITAQITPGTEIEYTPTLGNNITSYFKDNVTTGTGNPEQGRGFDLGFQLNAFK